MTQTNLAYDLERFEQHTPVPEQKPQISVRRERSIHPLKIMAVAVLIFAMGFSLLYSRVIITELNADINAAETRLDVLHAEQVRMQTELDGKMSLKAIEEAAISEYGMVKPDGSQVSYVQVTTENKLEGKAKEEGFFEKIYQFIRDLFE